MAEWYRTNGKCYLEAQIEEWAPSSGEKEDTLVR